MDFHGLTEDEVLSSLESGETITSIAASVGASKSMLSRWLSSEPERSARAREARRLAAAAWDEKAEAEIRAAAGPFELSKAKELAHHYRWRSSKADPRDYGDKVDVTLNDKRGAQDLTNDDLLRIASAGSAGTAEAPGGQDEPRQIH